MRGNCVKCDAVSLDQCDTPGLLGPDDDIDTLTLSRPGPNVRSQEQLDDVLKTCGADVIILLNSRVPEL